MYRLLLFALTVSGSVSAQPFSLHVEADPVPPGAMAQVRVYLRGGAAQSIRADLSFDPRVFEAIDSMQAYSANGDQYGVGSITASLGATVQAYSTSRQLGLVADLPVATVQVKVLETAQVGTRGAITVTRQDVNGQRVTPLPPVAALEIGGLVSIARVHPGFGWVEPGETVLIEGTGFGPDTAAEIEGAATTPARVVSAEWLELMVTAPAEITGMRARVAGREYFITSRPPLPLSSTQQWMHLFPRNVVKVARPYSGVPPLRSAVLGVRNPGRVAARVIFEETYPTATGVRREFWVQPGEAVICNCTKSSRGSSTLLIASEPVHAVTAHFEGSTLIEAGLPSVLPGSP